MAVTFARNLVLLQALIVMIQSVVCSATAQTEDLGGGDFALNPTISVPELPTLSTLDSRGGVPNENELDLVAKHGDALGYCLLGLPVVAVLIGHQDGGVFSVESVGVLEPVWAAAECGVGEHGVAAQLSLQDFGFPDDSIV